jgi:hypothetical protein
MASLQGRWLKMSVGIAAISLGVVAMMLSQHYLYPRYLFWRFENTIQQQPVFMLIQQYHPKEYEAYISTVKESFQESENMEVVSSHTANLLNEIFSQHLEKAPNAPIDLYLKSTVELFQYLYTKQPEAVVLIETGRRDPSVDFKELSNDPMFDAYLTRVLDAKKLIIQGSIETPITKWDHEKAKVELEKIYDNLSKKFGAEIIKGIFVPSQTVIPPRVSSMVILELYGEILATGQEKSGDIMRYIGSLNVAKMKK